MALVFNPFWFDWGALATAMTGAAAVWAARSVGLRQVAISEKQVEQGSASIRIALFERRAAIYDATEAFVQSVLLVKSPPENYRAIDRAFSKATSEAEYLFDPGFADRLRAIGRTASEVMGSSARRPTAAENSASDDAGWLSSHMIKRDALKECWRSLPDLFGPYLRIEEPAP